VLTLYEIRLSSGYEKSTAIKYLKELEAQGLVKEIRDVGRVGDERLFKITRKGAKRIGLFTRS